MTNAQSTESFNATFGTFWVLHVTDTVEQLRNNYEAAKARAEAAQQERERAFYLLREAEISAAGCKVTGFTVDFCATCGRDEATMHLCPNALRKKEGEA